MKYLMFTLFFFLGQISFGQGFNPGNWSYIPIDSTKQKWGDWESPEWLKYFGLDYGDINSDGYIDIISGRYVYLNPGGDMTGHWNRVALADNVDAILYLDVDQDIFGDFIAQALPDVYWYEAANEKGTEYTRTKIADIPATDHVNSQGFETAQLVADEQEEILIAGNNGIYVISIPDKNPENGNWPVQLIAPNTSSEGIGMGDIDNDGYVDIAAGRPREGEKDPTELVWFKNPGHIDKSWKAHIVGHTNHDIDRVEIADLTGDNQNEIILTEERWPGLEPDANLFWFSNQEDQTKEWKRHWITTQYSTNNLDVGDIDKDGDIDFVTGEHKGNDLELQLWENNGKGGFTKHVIDTGKENHLGTQFVDLDKDGDLDIVGIGWDEYEWVHVWRNDQDKVTGGKQLDPEKVEYEGKSHFEIKSGKITYYYDIEGGGFSRIIDQYGNDWISFKREPWNKYPQSAASAFRGLPNLVYKGDNNGAGHPGHDQCKSWIEGNKIITETKNGKWKWSWSFFDNYAVMDIVKTDPNRKYWFLYEGTPGGKFAPETYYYGTNLEGPKNNQLNYYEHEVEEGIFRWIYSGTSFTDNVFYILQMQEDKHADVIAYLGANSEKGLNSKDGMNIYAFGRDKHTHPKLSTPQKFVIGFYPHQIINKEQHQTFSEYINNKFLE